MRSGFALLLVGLAFAGHSDIAHPSTGTGTGTGGARYCAPHVTRAGGTAIGRSCAIHRREVTR